MKTKKLISMCLTVAMLAGLLAGCGNSTGATSTTGTTDSSGAAEATETVVEEEVKVVAEDEQVQIGYSVDASMTADQIESAQRSVINYAIEADCVDFDPFTYSTSGKEALVGLYQPLAYMIDGEVVSCLMKDYSFSDDGLTMYGEIYDYITDSEGNNIIASDVVFSWEMSEEYATLGTKEFIDSFVATGDYTFEVNFKRELGVGRLDKLVKFFIVSEKAYNEHEMHTDPVPTGPYVLTDHVSGYSFTYEKRDNYWQTDESLISARDMANVDKINFFVIAEGTQRTIALKNGSVDASIGISAEDLEYFDDSEDFWLSAIPDDLCMTLVANCDGSHLTSDVNLRKAVYYAISNEAILESVYDGNGTALRDWCAPWAVGYNPEWSDETDNYYTYDLDKAKEYLDQSSYNGETLVIVTSGSSSTMKDVAQMVSSMLEQIGIKTEINAVDQSILKEKYADVTAWDLFLNNNATNTYWIDGINGFLTKDKANCDGTPTFWYETDLQDMLVEYMQMDNATAENFEILRDYVMDNALGYGIVNPLTYVVVPSWCSGVCMSYKKTMTPGGNTYLSE